MDLNISKLPARLQKELPDILEKFNINSKLRLAHFLAQCAHESANFTIVRENLNYSVAGLLKTFPKYFKTKEYAILYARRPEKIANCVYADRMGNGAEISGNGWKYRGRGYIQLTGKDNYISFGRYVGRELITNPDLVATDYPLLSAAYFWHSKNLNVLADLNDLTGVTRKVNGGSNGLKDRQVYFEKYYALL